MNFGIMWKKGLMAFLIALAVVVVTSVLAGLEAFVPPAGFEWVWNLLAPLLIGAVTALLNWLKHRNK